jgi:hypothetical protein
MGVRMSWRDGGGPCRGDTGHGERGGRRVIPTARKAWQAPLPKGLYYLGYLQYYEAGRFNDGDGNSGLLPDFKVKAEAAVTRVVWVTDKKFLGADYAMHVVVPVVNVDARIAGMSGNRSGVSDVTIDPIILGWHFRNGWHVITGLDINLPVGSYDRASIANFSRHYWNVEPIVAFAYYREEPAARREDDVRHQLQEHRRADQRFQPHRRGVSFGQRIPRRLCGKLCDQPQGPARLFRLLLQADDW